MYALQGRMSSVAVGRLSFALGLTGPSVSVDTACSASLVAVHAASQSLKAQECSHVLVAGVNMLLHPAGMGGSASIGVLQEDLSGRCFTFDKRAKGIVHAEACAAVMLRTSSPDLKAPHVDHTLRLRGSAVRQSGRTASMTAPSGIAQKDMITAAHAAEVRTPCPSNLSPQLP